MRNRATPRKVTACVVALTFVAAVAGCGGGGGSSSDPGSSKYDPATTTLKQAGLEACSEVSTQTAGSIVSKDGLVATRAFAVAPDCNGKKASPDAIAFHQYDSKSSVDAAAAKLAQSQPSATYTTYSPLIIVATGPHKQAYLEKVKAVLQSRGQSSTTTG